MTGRNMDNFTNEDMAIPELKLIQPTGGDAAKEAGALTGELYVPLYDQRYDGLDVIIVDMQKTRTYWGRTEIGEEPPQCSSNNADSGISQDGKDCENCEHRCDTPWLLDAQDRRTKCLLNYNILALNLTDGNNSPMIIRAGGISTRAVKELLTQLRTSRALKQAGMHRGVVHVSSEKKKSTSGTAYALRFKLKGLVESLEQANELLAISSDLIGTDISALAPGADLPQLPKAVSTQISQPSIASQPSLEF